MVEKFAKKLTKKAVELSNKNQKLHGL